MSNVSTMEPPKVRPEDLAPQVEEAHVLRKNWGWFLALGIALIALGTLAIGSSLVATLATVIAFGTLLLLGGGVQIVGAFFSRKWKGFFQELLVGVLYLVIGFMMLANPAATALAVTLMVGAFLLISGVFRIVASVIERFEGWGWVFVSGLISAALGIMIWQQWPVSGLWVIGLFVGIEMLFSGWHWVMLAIAARQFPKRVGMA